MRLRTRPPLLTLPYLLTPQPTDRSNLDVRLFVPLALVGCPSKPLVLLSGCTVV